MFKIHDGRNSFFQWDLDRKLIVEDKTVKEAHFSNPLFPNALVCEVYKQNGLNMVDVPNILLQSDIDIRVYGYDGSCVKCSGKFEVNKRTKPESYIYTETEVKTYDALELRIKEVETYLEENPLDIDLSAYALKTEIANFQTAEQVATAISTALGNIKMAEEGAY